jgi:pimeloyl-ACP methyl ester carboxylesterase
VAHLYSEARRRGKRLVLCGHSLGGAVAAVCALRLLLQLSAQPSSEKGGRSGADDALRCLRVVSFAQPPVGDAAAYGRALLLPLPPDAVLLTEVYPAGEAPIVAADGRALMRALRVTGKVEPLFVADIADLPQAILDNARSGDVVLCMGAGSIGLVAGKVIERAGVQP